MRGARVSVSEDGFDLVEDFLLHGGVLRDEEEEPGEGDGGGVAAGEDEVGGDVAEEFVRISVAVVVRGLHEAGEEVARVVRGVLELQEGELFSPFCDDVHGEFVDDVDGFC